MARIELIDICKSFKEQDKSIAPAILALPLEDVPAAIATTILLRGNQMA